MNGTLTRRVLTLISLYLIVVDFYLTLLIPSIVVCYEFEKFQSLEHISLFSNQHNMQTMISTLYDLY